jgi:hypothetical protein
VSPSCCRSPVKQPAQLTSQPLRTVPSPLLVLINGWARTGSALQELDGLSGLSVSAKLALVFAIDSVDLTEWLKEWGLESLA